MSATRKNKITSEARCGTRTELVRADDLRLGDAVLLTGLNNTVRVAVVESLRLVGDDVEMTFFGVQGETTTSVGNTFQTVEVR